MPDVFAINGRLAIQKDGQCPSIPDWDGELDAESGRPLFRRCLNCLAVIGSVASCSGRLAPKKSEGAAE